MDNIITTKSIIKFPPQLTETLAIPLRGALSEGVGAASGSPIHRSIRVHHIGQAHSILLLILHHYRFVVPHFHTLVEMHLLGDHWRRVAVILED